MNKAKNNAQGATGSTDVTVDQAKIDACNKEVADFMATSRFTAGTDIEAVRKARFDACMAKS